MIQKLMMTDQEIINVIAAHQEGKTIQYKDSYSGEWIIATSPSWNFADSDYRIKPKPREWWFVKDVGQTNLYGWSRHDVRQEGVDYLEQVHVREVL